MVAMTTVLFVGGSALAVPAPAGADTPATAQLITVTGSPLSNVVVSSKAFTASTTPAFSQTIYNYIVNCPSGTSSVKFKMRAAAGTITVGGATGSTEAASVSLTTNQAAVIEAPSAVNAGTSVQYWFRCIPTDFPTLKAVTDTGQAPEGYYLTQTALDATGTGPYVMILDNHGTPVWWQKTVPGGAGWFQQWTSNTLAWDSASNGGTPNFNNAAGYTTYNLKTGATGTVVPNDAPADGHAILHLSDGNNIFLTDPEVTGVDLSSIGHGTNQNVVDCNMQEDTPSGQVVWSWDGLQHLGIDESLYPISDTVDGQQVWDLFHCNSMSLDENDSNQETADIVLSSRENSSIYLIDRSTGAIIWKVGGVKPSASDPDASAQYLNVVNDPETQFYAQHDATLSATGELTLFDDHSGAPLYMDPTETAGPARGVQYKINTTAGTATLNWSYVTPDDENSLATGSFNRYTSPNGGTDNVIGWGLNDPITTGGVTTSKLFSEVNGSGKVTLAVDWVEPDGATFPGINGEYRVIKLSRSQLSLNLLRKNMGGL
jgi:hypothetical protein